MNTILRRFFILAAVLLCCTALANAAIRDVIEIDGIYYILDNKNYTATVTWGGEDSNSCTEGYSGDIVIPEKIRRYTVTSIGDDAFEKCSGLTSITIPNSVTSIESEAFKGCSGLTSITIPNSVTSIGDDAFENCSGLTSITIPNSVTSIGDDAFENCSGLTSITIPNSVTSIGDRVFENCSGLTSITIPNSVTSIGNFAFAGCNKLKSVHVSWEIPLAISQYVFDLLNTSEITLHIPYGTLDAYSTADVWNTFDLDGIVLFADANAETISVKNWDTDHDNLLSTKEAAVVEDLGDAFSGTAITSFNELKYFTGLKSIGESAFQGTAITSIEIPTTITSIGNNAFKDCGNLKFVSIPATVTSIRESAFKNCTGLKEIYVKNQSPLSISSNVFENVATTCLLRVPNGSVTSYQEADVWKSFSNIQDNAIQFEDPEVKAICLANWDTNKDGVLTYEEAAAIKEFDYTIGTKFADNPSITSFEELKYFTGLKVIGEWAFSGCTNLASITIPNSVTTIGKSAFNGCTGLTSVTIPSSVTSIEKYAFNGCTGLTSVTIPNSVTTIGERAFNGCTGLTSVTILNNVTSIGEWAFSGCSDLASITIPNSVTSIGEEAFYGCTNLQNIGINIVDFANNNIIYDYFGTSKTIKYYYNGEEISGELTIPEATTAIGKNALKGVTGLTAVTIPNSVTSIGERAFSGCTGLEAVSVQWTEKEKIPDISEKNVFNGINLADVILDLPYKNGNIRPLYAAKDVWKDFNIVFAKNFIITKSDYTTIEQKVSENSEITIDESANDIEKISVVEDAPSVKSITYTRDFTNVVGKWQAWFVPFEAPVSVLNEASIDVAEIAGILLNSEGETIVAFKKIEGDSKKMHANTPYVVRMGNDATTIATLVFENTNLKETAESEYYAMSMYEKFTFTGNYETQSFANSYSLNTKGEFQKMANDAVLGPMRFSLAVTPRDDSPYADETPNSSPRPAIRYMILGDDSSLQPIDGDLQQDDEKTMRAMTPAISLKPRTQQTFIYDLRGRKVNRIQSKQVYIIDGKKFIAR